MLYIEYQGKQILKKSEIITVGKPCLILLGLMKLIHIDVQLLLALLKRKLQIESAKKAQYSPLHEGQHSPGSVSCICSPQLNVGQAVCLQSYPSPPSCNEVKISCTLLL